MDALEQLRGAIPDAAKDIRLNLQAVLRGGALSEAQRWGVAAAAAVAAGAEGLGPGRLARTMREHMRHPHPSAIGLIGNTLDRADG